MKQLALFLIFLPFVCFTITAVKAVQFQQDCGGYLKQAADANSVELATERLNLAIDYIEKNNLTEGYTSILWKTENDNIEFWYNNLKACQKELEEVKESSQLEKTNVLMKVRESLTDDRGKNGTVLNTPCGISRYPHNTAFAIFNIISCLLLCFGLFILFVEEW